MQSTLSSFQDNISRVKALHALYIAFSSSVTVAVDLTDILRAEIVLAASALDHYVHELTWKGMTECWRGARPATDQFKKFRMQVDAAVAIMSNPTQGTAIFEAEVRGRHAFASFMQPDKIADAVRLFSDVKLWDDVSHELGISSKDARDSIAVIVNRRNQIAHEADIDPSYPGQRWPIDEAMVASMVTTIEQIVIAIHKVVI